MTLSTVHVDPSALAAAIEHARSAWPAEICGLFGGRDHRLERAVPVANIAEPPPGQCGFYMDPTGQFRATRALEDQGLDITGGKSRKARLR
jgi:proteasome lid subunit RPN8/RPN11